MHDVVAVLGRDRDDGQVGAAEPRGHLPQLRFHLGEPTLVEVDQVDLVDGGDEVLDAQQLCDPGMSAGLPQHPGAGVDEQDRDVRIGRAGEHVAGVALVAGGVGEDVAAVLGREEPVGNVDGDALFTLGAQTVGQRGQVGDAFFVGDGFQVIQRQAVGVVHQPPDQRALAVVDRSRRGDPQQLAGLVRRHQKYPSRLRSSIAAADVRSSARVSPRSETVAAEISAITPVISVAVDRTAPVMVRSPTVR